MNYLSHWEEQQKTVLCCYSLSCSRHCQEEWLSLLPGEWQSHFPHSMLYSLRIRCLSTEDCCWIPATPSRWRRTGTLVSPASRQPCSGFSRVSRSSASLLCSEHYPQSSSHPTLKKQSRKPWIKVFCKMKRYFCPFLAPHPTFYFLRLLSKHAHGQKIQIFSFL